MRTAPIPGTDSLSNPSRFQMLLDRAATSHTTPEQGWVFLFIALKQRSLQVAVSFLFCQTAITLFSNCETDALAARQRDKGLLLADDEHVSKTCGKGVADSILDVDNVKRPVVTLTVGDVSNTSQVTTTNDHDEMTVVELDEVLDLSGRDVKLDRIVNLDGRVRIADRSAIVCHKVRDTLGAGLHAADTEKLVL